jgi:hypothetical protein
VKILGKWPVRSQRAGALADARRVGMVASRVTIRELDKQCEGPGRYEPPRIMVIGNVRDLTTGSSSSGKKDANSQYYW